MLSSYYFLKGEKNSNKMWKSIKVCFIKLGYNMYYAKGNEIMFKLYEAEKPVWKENLGVTLANLTLTVNNKSHSPNDNSVSFNLVY